MPKRATLEENIKINATLSTIIQKLPNGYVQYISPWSDLSVAQKLGVNQFSVAHVRKKMYGNINDPPHGIRNVNALQLQVNQYENTILNLERRVDDLEHWAKGRGYTVPAGRMQVVSK